MSQASDVYAFGICALEVCCVCVCVSVPVMIKSWLYLQMLALELLGNGESRPKVHIEEIQKAIDSLQNESHKVNRLCHNQ